MRLEDKFSDGDITAMLGWLLPPEEPARTTEESAEEFEARQAAHDAKTEELNKLSDRLSGLFEDYSWAATGNERTLKRYLAEWILTPEKCTEFGQKVAAGGSDGEAFLEWLAGEITGWEAGEGQAQENPEFDQARPWSRYYKYDASAQVYLYAGEQHADEWLTWEEWEPEEETGSDAPVAAPAEQGYPVYTHAGSGLALPYHEASGTWLYQDQWLTSEQVTAAVTVPADASSGYDPDAWYAYVRQVMDELIAGNPRFAEIPEERRAVIASEALRQLQSRGS